MAKLDTGKLDACLAKQDETQVRASIRRPSLGVDGHAGAVHRWRTHQRRDSQEQIWPAIDRALRAAGIDPPALRRRCPAREPADAPGGGKSNSHSGQTAASQRA